MEHGPGLRGVGIDQVDGHVAHGRQSPHRPARFGGFSGSGRIGGVLILGLAQQGRQTPAQTPAVLRHVQTSCLLAAALRRWRSRTTTSRASFR